MSFLIKAFQLESEGSQYKPSQVLDHVFGHNLAMKLPVTFG